MFKLCLLCFLAVIVNCKSQWLQRSPPPAYHVLPANNRQQYPQLTSQRLPIAQSSIQSPYRFNGYPTPPAELGIADRYPLPHEVAEQDTRDRRKHRPIKHNLDNRDQHDTRAVHVPNYRNQQLSAINDKHRSPQDTAVHANHRNQPDTNVHENHREHHDTREIQEPRELHEHHKPRSEIRDNKSRYKINYVNHDYENIRNDPEPTLEPLTPHPNVYKIRPVTRPGNRRRNGRRRFRSSTTTTTTTTTTAAPEVDYYDNYYDDEYYDYATTTTTTTTKRPRRRGGRRRSGRPRETTTPLTTTASTTTTTTPSTTTTTLSPNYKHREDGRIIDYLADPNFPYELRGSDLTNYPFYIILPEDIDFSCDGRHDGYYANIEHKCQVYHHCAVGHRYDFLCANYTAFDQSTFTCRFVNQFDCGNSANHFHRNEELYVETTEESSNNNNRNALNSSKSDRNDDRSKQSDKSSNNSNNQSNQKARKR